MLTGGLEDSIPVPVVKKPGDDRPRRVPRLHLASGKTIGALYGKELTKSCRSQLGDYQFLDQKVGRYRTIAFRHSDKAYVVSPGPVVIVLHPPEQYVVRCTQIANFGLRLSHIVHQARRFKIQCLDPLIRFGQVGPNQSHVHRHRIYFGHYGFELLAHVSLESSNGSHKVLKRHCRRRRCVRLESFSTHAYGPGGASRLGIAFDHVRLDRSPPGRSFPASFGLHFRRHLASRVGRLAKGGDEQVEESRNSDAPMKQRCSGLLASPAEDHSDREGSRRGRVGGDRNKGKETESESNTPPAGQMPGSRCCSITCRPQWAAESPVAPAGRPESSKLQKNGPQGPISTGKGSVASAKIALQKPVKMTRIGEG